MKLERTSELRGVGVTISGVNNPEEILRYFLKEIALIW